MLPMPTALQRDRLRASSPSSPPTSAIFPPRKPCADLLVTVRLIEEDRDSEAFTIGHPTTRVALTCAALSAMRRHVTGSDDPKVTRLVNSSLMLVSRLDKVSPLLAKQSRLCSSTLNHLWKAAMGWKTRMGSCVMPSQGFPPA